jgi:putative transposase
MAVPPRRTYIPGTYFITSRTWESRKLFIKTPVCEIVIETLLHYRDKNSYLLHSFVLMPDHVHLILTPGPEISLERAVQFVKGGSARRISRTLNYHLPVWQRGYTDHRIRDVQDYENHLRYIEENPVKAGLTTSAKEYPWCSACGRFPMDDPPQGLKPLRNGTYVGTVETVPLRPRR